MLKTYEIIGIPLVDLHVSFKVPSRLSEVVTVESEITEWRRRSSIGCSTKASWPWSVLKSESGRVFLRHDFLLCLRIFLLLLFVNCHLLQCTERSCTGESNTCSQEGLHGDQFQWWRESLEKMGRGGLSCLKPAVGQAVGHS
jgi:hypothetical protein